MGEPLKIGVLVSGSGTNLQAIIDAIADGLPVEIVHVVSSRPDAYGIERAKSAGIPVLVLNRGAYADTAAADTIIAETLKASGADEQGNPVVLTAIPYYSWANRGKGAMRVWLPVVKG